ncbi:hypothetical protein ACWGRF_08645 [Streptomyces zhihengii]
MERITEEQVNDLARFVLARVPAVISLQGDALRAATALRVAAYKQIAAVRFHRDCGPEQAAETALHAAASWNLLVAVAEVWRDHPDFPAVAAAETFEYDSETPLSPHDTCRDVAG